VTEPPVAGTAGDHSRIVNHVLVPSPGVYAIDPVHTFVGFVAQHLVVGRVRGRFERVAGTVTIAEELTESSLEVTVETASISTLFGARNEDLRSRFLDCGAHPTMTYQSTGIIERPRGEWRVLGDLTVRGVTKPVALVVRFGGSITNSQGKARAAFTATGTLTRSEFGIVAELETESGSMRIGDDISLDIEAEATLSGDFPQTAI
jgi:polyisoprenoid-binding protein YceI